MPGDPEALDIRLGHLMIMHLYLDFPALRVQREGRRSLSLCSCELDMNYGVIL